MEIKHGNNVAKFGDGQKSDNVESSVKIMVFVSLIVNMREDTEAHLSTIVA
jgi:hypothetical protein